MRTGRIGLVGALLVGACLMPATMSLAADDGLARTPPMGWNSWNKFVCDVSETLIKEAADAMVTSGMKDAGYEYVVIDDCWQVSRDAEGNIVADPERFPSGMKALGDYIHSKGLKFGIYSDAGEKTCQSRPGSLGHEEQDAQQYAAWGVDYLKYDWCFTEGVEPREAYTKMRRALTATGRPIVLSMCEWGLSEPWRWAQGIAHQWRATHDIQDCWDCSRPWGGMGLVHIIDLMADLYPYAGPGHWNDADMLEVGNGGMSLSEYRAHFSFWCLFASPLMAGNDIRDMPAETSAILLNKDAIAVNQDPLGIQGRKVYDRGPYEVWMKPLVDGGRAVIFFNRGSEAAPIRATWEQLGLGAGAKAQVRDLWAQKDRGEFTGFLEMLVGPHDVRFMRVTP